MSQDSLPDEVLSKLQTVFKLEKFRPQQEEVIATLLRGKSALFVAPTGVGKSLCYQLPAAVNKDPVLVISPLIALMEDQVKRARQWGLRAAALHSAMSSEQREINLQLFKDGRLQLLYVTPERFRKPAFVQMLAGRKISLLAVDEAHCISQWGHDFRPDYSRLGEFRKILGDPVTLAVTATATAVVQDDILQSLNLESAARFVGGFSRPNICLNVHDLYGWESKIRALVGLRHQVPGPGIVYVSLIQSLQNLSRELARLNLPHLIYHGDLSPGQRQDQQRKFQESDSALLLATPAFGLGVDKANIRLLVHGEMSGSIESYYQEVGRSGRDGLAAEAHLLLDQDDISIQMDFIKWANPDSQFVRKVFQLIQDNPLRLQQEGVTYLREQMNFYNSRDFRVESSLHILERAGCLERGPDSDRFRYRIADPWTEDVWPPEKVAARGKVQNQKLLQMVQYSQMQKGCRAQVILKYFGEDSKPCGRCDLCKAKGVDA